MRRIRITMSYDGTDYHGWQIQPNLPTIQGVVQDVLAKIESGPVHVTASGRTDAGVHALAQVAAFDLQNPIPPVNLCRAMNRLLPPDIRVLEAAGTVPGFHPIRDAVAKTYEYRIHRAGICPPFDRRYVLHFPYPLDEDRLHFLAPVFAGTHDFTAFAASDKRDEQERSKVRSIFHSGFHREGDRLVYRVRGSGFLKHMVRNMVGTLLEAGRGRLDQAGLERWLEPGRADKAGATAPPQGLFLVGVEY